MIITVASGKGGTGKTTVATSLSLAMSDLSPVYLDCDVEAPNGHIFLKPKFDHRKDVAMMIPEVDSARCKNHGRCAEVCQFNAIVALGGEVLIFPELCHGCGSCSLHCPEKAIKEVPYVLGCLEAGVAVEDIRYVRGILNIGEPMAVPIIRELKDWNPHGAGNMTIRDAPPGTSCPVVESIAGADFVLLVTEPTPFGLHDLDLALKLTRELEIPGGVVVNRDGIGDFSIDEYCEQAGIPILMRIPMDRRIGESIARGEMLVEAFPEYLQQFRDLHSQILDLTHPDRVAARTPPVETFPTGSLEMEKP